MAQSTTSTTKPAAKTEVKAAASKDAKKAPVKAKKAKAEKAKTEKACPATKAEKK